MTASDTEPIEPKQATQAYLHDLKLGRLSRFAFVLFAGMFFAWAIPYLPRGLDPSAYAAPSAFAIMLAMAAVNLAILSMVYFFRASRRRDVLLAWGAMFDEATGLHNRQYFVDRLDLEMARATVKGRSFRVFLLQAQRQGKDGKIERLSREELVEMAAMMKESLNASETIASLRPDEIAVLVPGVALAVVEPTDQRILDAVKRFLGRAGSGAGPGWRLRLGSLTYDGEASDPMKLIDATRRLASEAPAIVVGEDRAA
ncbi:MAG: GGDEF domain-containing protein [Chloroflexota bacterium]|nr:GGDEF domain-containing protein [Chloroflexota bacterium]